MPARGAAQQSVFFRVYGERRAAFGSIWHFIGLQCWLSSRISRHFLRYRPARPMMSQKSRTAAQARAFVFGASGNAAP